VSIIDLAARAEDEGVSKIQGLNIGGTIDVKGIKLTMVQALHTAIKGVPTGVIVTGEDRTIYHAGDTGIFGDMRLLGELYKFDVAMLPIGGYYTMDAKQASEAVKLLNPKVVIPMHYKTFPVLAQSIDEFAKYVKEKAPQVKIVALKPGETYQF
jgi:L-ascorbate metabolism protein UlaG (beta-lactamase superfamily)